MSISHRKAKISDLENIVAMLQNDDLGKSRETKSAELDSRYIKAFQKIDADPNQYLMITEEDGNTIGTCHLTLIPSLTFTGQTRLQIEAVRVHHDFRGKGIGEWMINAAIDYAKENDASIIQLTSNKQRTDAIRFYEKIGFASTHEGMKLYLKP